MSEGLAGAEADYVASTPRSRELHGRAVRALPGGSTRTTTYFPPYPLAIERGEGCRVWDVDGTERLDLIGNYTAMILGHAHPAILSVLSAQAARGTGFAAVTGLEVELAEELRDRVPSVELGVLLVFDEVISLRVASGGAQERYGVTPDLTTMGKIIGGGLPVAAFGGRADVMALVDPRREGFLTLGGTYNGNPLGMAAGLATMTELTPDVYEDRNRTGARVAELLRA